MLIRQIDSTGRQRKLLEFNSLIQKLTCPRVNYQISLTKIPTDLIALTFKMTIKCLIMKSHVILVQSVPIIIPRAIETKI